MALLDTIIYVQSFAFSCMLSWFFFTKTQACETEEDGRGNRDETVKTELSNEGFTPYLKRFSQNCFLIMPNLILFNKVWAEISSVSAAENIMARSGFICLSVFIIVFFMVDSHLSLFLCIYFLSFIYLDYVLSHFTWFLCVPSLFMLPSLSLPRCFSAQLLCITSLSSACALPQRFSLLSPVPLTPLHPPRLPQYICNVLVLTPSMTTDDISFTCPFPVLRSTSSCFL